MTSFGPTDQMNQAFSTLGANNTAASGAAVPNVNSGTSNLAAGANFFKTILGGNQADTSALLQPDINRVNNANQQTLQAVSTLTPRGGGRSASLFALPFQGNQQIQGLFNQARTGAASALPQIGSAQGSLGSNLFGIANQGAGELVQGGQRQQQITSALQQGLGNGLFNLFTTPVSAFTGGLLGKL